MSVYFIGDPHLGHRAIAKYRPWIKSSQENTDMITSCWKKVIRKKDVVYVMGDAAFDEESLQVFKNLPGKKILIKGNHDDMILTSSQTEVFHEIHGIISYKKMWLSHAPIHPSELRNRLGCIHGHVHQQTIMKGWGPFKREDPRYINTCVDVIWPKYNSVFISLDQIKTRLGLK
jgi:calcineurin-like phosphoesterase family protein